MGTPEFAQYSLKALVDNGYNIVAVVTMPDKPQGRGHKVQFSPVKTYALTQDIPVLQPEKLKDPDFVEQLRSYNADLQIVVAFRMLPEVVWAMPPMGTFNLHASLLPQYRGAAPINWAVINGEKQTGATTFFLKQEIDTGDMILQRSIDIDDNEDAGSVHDRLMVMGAQMVLDTTNLIALGQARRQPQPALAAEELKPAPKIFRETCQIDFNKPAQQVHNFVRGLSPYPAAWCEATITNDDKQTVKIYKTSLSGITANAEPGTLLTDKKNYIRIACADQWIDIVELQLPNKKRMTAKELLNGIVNS